jgi:hypothetical protein
MKITDKMVEDAEKEERYASNMDNLQENYTREEVKKLVTTAFYKGVETGGVDYGDESFDAEDFLIKDN